MCNPHTSTSWQGIKVHILLMRKLCWSKAKEARRDCSPGLSVIFLHHLTGGKADSWKGDQFRKRRLKQKNHPPLMYTPVYVQMSLGFIRDWPGAFATRQPRSPHPWCLRNWDSERLMGVHTRAMAPVLCSRAGLSLQSWPQTVAIYSGRGGWGRCYLESWHHLTKTCSNSGDRFLTREKGRLFPAPGAADPVI